MCRSIEPFYCCRSQHGTQNITSIVCFWHPRIFRIHQIIILPVVHRYRKWPSFNSYNVYYNLGWAEHVSVDYRFNKETVRKSGHTACIFNFMSYWVYIFLSLSRSHLIATIRIFNQKRCIFKIHGENSALVSASSSGCNEQHWLLFSRTV